MAPPTYPIWPTGSGGDQDLAHIGQLRFSFPVLEGSLSPLFQQEKDYMWAYSQLKALQNEML